jgi:hypothetical protein
VIEPLLSASSNGSSPAPTSASTVGVARTSVRVFRRPALGRDLAVVDAELQHVALEVRNWKRA